MCPATSPRAHVHALIGPNGAGKTTLFNIVSGTLRPTTGRIAFDGHDYTGRRPDRVLKMGIARNFQHVRLIRGLSIVENVMIGCHTWIDRGILGNTAALFGLATGELAAAGTRRGGFSTSSAFPPSGTLSRWSSASAISVVSRLPARSPASRGFCFSTNPPPA